MLTSGAEEPERDCEESDRGDDKQSAGSECDRPGKRETERQDHGMYEDPHQQKAEKD